MWTKFIQVRKKTWLPMKFWFERKKKASQIEYPSTLIFLEKSDEVRNKLLRAEREGDTSKIEYWKGATEIIDWIMSYGETNEKRN